MAEPVLAARGLGRSFGALVAVDGLDLDLLPGEIHALIGPNGAGKSTALGLIAGDIRADAGSIRLRGREVGRLDAAGRARLGLARSFQVSAILPEFSAFENVLLAVQAAAGSSYRFVRPVRRDRRLAEAAHAQLARIGLAHRAAERAAILSHGERRRLELAMALARRPRALLLDEPMAGLGPDGAQDLTDLLDQIRHDAPILLIEHDMDAVFALADRISVMVGGRRIACGRPGEIRADAAVQRAYLGEDA